MEYLPNSSAKYIGTMNVLHEDEIGEPIGILDINNKETSFSIITNTNLEGIKIYSLY